MFHVKKCAECGNNSFKLLYDTQALVACEACGQTYQQTSFKRLPDDLVAMQKLKVTVNSICKEIICV